MSNIYSGVDILTCVTEDLGNHGVGRQVVKHVTLVSANGCDNVASRVQGERSGCASMRAEVSNFIAVLENLH